MTRNITACAEFYRSALGFMVDGPMLGLGEQQIWLQAGTGADYPAARASNDPWFQHLAIVVNDIAAAFDHATRHGATAISTDGPQRLPASSGGVTAWKFRDPEGHPLELLQFPPDATPPCWQGRDGLFLGIDHTAIVVAGTQASETFYRTLGFERAAQSHNRGPAQAALDGLAAPHVLVTALRIPGQAVPHLELLDYLTPNAPAGTWTTSDIAATRIVMSGTQPLSRDPDGHCIEGVSLAVP
ncbi:VOC family protein [Acidiphilium sp.]|uniref:VOC family protein n=1 Tax=Acidiphilium sp. TaxID=527 RepID=UPI003D036684